MTKLLITGATGNVGLAVLQALQKLALPLEIRAGVRNPQAEAPKMASYGATAVPFDFEDARTFAPALAGVDGLFLLRPPQLADVNKYFAPLISQAQQAGVRHIVFLSVQGVEGNRLVPHYKIERLIEASQVPYTFLRPAYFMQNFTTTLRDDLVKKNQVFLPAGRAKFTLIDVDDLGLVAAHVLANPGPHLGQKYDLTNHEQLTFGQMAEQLSTGLGRRIEFISPNLWRFYWTKRREKVPPMLVLVMIMLHYLPRFRPAPGVTTWAAQITGQPPKSFAAFVAQHRVAWSG
ncbi:MAG: NmrA family NAD(P)-binding protein [Bernardetiaceae bacterium]|jgi:uncharacterized protein YbjT (DUF2867 family)|nr:NmrA family NAD(P)-binding protein [Bernardetiaceae bacterium]